MKVDSAGLCSCSPMSSTASYSQTAATAGFVASARACQQQPSFHCERSDARAAPLFGPQGERAWAGEDWNPQFVFPTPARDIEGAVFTVRHGEHTAVWVNTVFDARSGPNAVRLRAWRICWPPPSMCGCIRPIRRTPEST